MNRIPQFSKVSFKQFLKDSEGYVPNYYTNDEIKKIYDNIKLPKRATLGSAGYDFFLPGSLYLQPRYSIKIPTGIRCEIDEEWVLKIYPRSSLGFKYKMQIDNGTAIIDSDYFDAKNEGHIWIKITNDNRENKSIVLNAGDAFVQGIFVPFGITKDDNVENVRIGGIGSTND